MQVKKTTFALMFGNRGFFPASLMDQARKELPARLKALGYETLMMDADATRHGAVETPEEGEKFAAFLAAHRGQFGGVILSLPNFGDETGAVAALQDAGVPILIQAYPDELDKMAPDQRRDSFCGKFSIMDVFCQYGVDFTALQPHTVHPDSDAFAANISYFDRLCRVVNGMRRLTIGAIGARTTPFKTVRIDEVALQRHGITTETLDLSEVFRRVHETDLHSTPCKDRAQRLQQFTTWDGVPEKAFENLVKLSVVIDEIVAEMKLDAVAVRCWTEMQQQLGISPCVLLGEMNERGIPAACEVDLGNAVTMYALRLASGQPPILLDWNNNYGDDPDKCILFHCGPVAASLMEGKGRITDHEIIKNAVGDGCSYGCNVGRIKPMDFTFSSMMTDEGQLSFYLGQGKFTTDPIPANFFGCAGVAQIEDLQACLQTIGLAGHRHHVSITPGHHVAPLTEAFTRYLGYDLLLV